LTSARSLSKRRAAASCSSELMILILRLLGPSWQPPLRREPLAQSAHPPGFCRSPRHR
jgi:hypothetical protein